MTIVILIYLALGYWAVGVTIYANKIRFGTMQNLFLQRVTLGCLLGWILIPIAVLKCIFCH